MSRRRNSSIIEKMVAIIEFEEPDYIKTAKIYGATFSQIAQYAQSRVDHSGGNEYVYDHSFIWEYTVLDEEEAEEAAAEYIVETMNYFSPRYMEHYLGIDADAIKCIQENMQDHQIQDVFERLLNTRRGLENFIDETIASNGIEHYLGEGNTVQYAYVKNNGYYLWTTN